MVYNLSMKYKIHEVAWLAEVSVRTLHYYDEIRLLVPEVNQENGYRLYSEKELTKLQQILFLSQVAFSALLTLALY